MPATFYAKVIGSSMITAGISEGDTIVIDRALEPRQNDIVVAYINGKFTMKYLDLSRRQFGEIWLHPGNDDYPSFRLTPDDEMTVWGAAK